jgi:hypothetical protein
MGFGYFNRRREITVSGKKVGGIKLISFNP